MLKIAKIGYKIATSSGHSAKREHIANHLKSITNLTLDIYGACGDREHRLPAQTTDVVGITLLLIYLLCATALNGSYTCTQEWGGVRCRYSVSSIKNGLTPSQRR